MSLQSPVRQSCAELSSLEVLPKFLDSELAWVTIGDDSSLEYVYHLTAQDCQEIESAFESFNEQDLYGDRVSRANFPLPTLQHTLRDLSFKVNEGCGYALIRGLDLDKYSVEDSTVIWLGIQSYIAETRLPQDQKNNMLVHITCNTPDSNPLTKYHIRHSNINIPFHNDDSGDILAFLTRSAAERGGRCLLSSAYRIYNDLAATQPEILQTLSRPNWPFFLPYPHERPILYQQGAQIIINIDPNSLYGSLMHPRPENLRPLSAIQTDALNAVEMLARKNCRVLSTEKGDMHFVNNLAILHSREAFEDDDDKQRHLVRMHLRNDELAWDLPHPLRGIWMEPLEYFQQVWHVEPMPDGFYPLRYRGT